MRNQLQKIIGLMMLMVLFGFNAFSQNPTYIMEIKNDVAVSPTEYTFDIYIKNTSVNPTYATSFELQGIQAGIRVNSLIRNVTGVITPTIVPGFSDMVAAQQHTNANLSMSGLTSGVPNANYGVKMTVKSVSVGSGTQILTTEMRVCRIKLTCSVPFTPNSLANLTWNLGTNIPWATKVSAYLPAATELQLLSVHSVANRNNPPLNAPTGPAIANVTGGGSFCAGTTPTGVSVGLDASNASYSYQLLKGGVAEGLPVVGTGAALVWNNLPVGVYTVQTTTTPAVVMALSATVTETALPATPLVNVVNDCGTSTLTITNAEAGATFLWTGGLTSNPINPAVGGIYTVTQTVGTCTSLPSADATAAPIEIPAAPVVSVMDNCGNSDLSTTAVGSLMWSNGMTTPTINVTMGGTFSVTTTVNGCISAASLLATAAPIAIPAAPVVSVMDNCGNSDLSTTATGTLLWSTGASTSTINVLVGGTYTVTATENGCTSAAGSGVAAPIATPATPVVAVMDNCGNSDLSTTATGTLLWSTGASTSTINVLVGGTYTVTATENGCTSAAGSGVAAPLATPATPVVAVMDNCGNSDLSTTATGTLLWSTGASTSSINVLVGGTYTVTATENGCTSAAGSGVAAPIAIPSAPSVTVVNNCGTSVLTADNFTGSLLWSTTEITPSITVTAANMYMVTQTVNGCTSAQAFGTAVPVAIPATPVVAVMDNCGNSDLSTTATGTLLWSTSASTSTINVLVGGTYTVTATENGCTSAAGSGVAAPVSPVTPSVAIAADMNNVVAGTMVTFTATPTNGGAPMYQWYVNTIAVGTGLATYAYAPVNGDVVKCVMTSDLTCVTSATANSNEITMIITVPGFITNTWLGNTTAWALATNWSLNLVPMANHNVVIPAGMANYPIIFAPAVCNDIFLASGAQLINTNTLAIGGTVKVQQFLSANNWHFFSSPVNNATAYTFSNVNPNNTGITMYLQKYNESWDGLSGTPWVDVAVGPAEVMSAGKGYEVWSNSNHTITMEGTQLNSTDVTIPLTWTSPNAILKGYNLIGNPFPSALTVVSSNTWPMANVLPALYLWSAGFGNYLDWDGALSGSLGGVIPANQSFFVRASGPAATYTIPAAAKNIWRKFL